MISKPRQCVVLLFMFSVILASISVVVPQQSMYDNKKMEAFKDLPVKNDLEKYLSALENIVSFADRNRLCVDMNFFFGLYLINVNLRSVMELKGRLLSFQKRDRLMHLMKTNDEILKSYIKGYQTQNRVFNPMLRMTNQICMVHNKKALCPKLAYLNVGSLKKSTFNSFRKKVKHGYNSEKNNIESFEWTEYIQNVFDHKKGTPSPTDSDHCLNSIANNPISKSISHNVEFNRCNVPYRCIEIVFNGTEYGYGISHRLLFLLMARYWRGCVIISDAGDKEMRENLCAKMYDEVEYIANHNFFFNDLAMEDITLCSLQGQAQFLRRSWIHNLLGFQTKEGNFKMVDMVKLTDGTFDTVSTTENKFCYSHTTGTAGSMLASAIRFIMENYYY